MLLLTTTSKVSIGLTLFTAVVALLFRGHLVVYTAILLFVCNLGLVGWAFMSARGVVVEREHVDSCLKGSAVKVRLSIKNLTKAPKFLLFGYDYFPAEKKSSMFKPVVFEAVGPREEASGFYSANAVRRGVFEIGPFYLYSGDPLGFYKYIKRIESYTKLTVIPVPIPLRMGRLSSSSIVPKDELSTIALSGHSTEFLGVREYQQGDPLRKIHWLSTARHGKLVTKMFEKNVASTLSFLMVNNDKSKVGKLEEHNPLEYSISIISSLANQVINRRNYLSFLELNGDTPRKIQGQGKEIFHRLSLLLAEITAGKPFELTDWTSEIANALPEGSDLLILIPVLTPADSEFVANLREHYKQVSVVTFNLESFRKGMTAKNGGSRISFGRNYLVYEIYYGDNLGFRMEQLVEKMGLLI